MLYAVVVSHISRCDLCPEFTFQFSIWKRNLNRKYDYSVTIRVDRKRSGTAAYVRHDLLYINHTHTKEKLRVRLHSILI